MTPVGGQEGSVAYGEFRFTFFVGPSGIHTPLRRDPTRELCLYLAQTASGKSTFLLLNLGPTLRKCPKNPTKSG